MEASKSWVSKTPEENHSSHVDLDSELCISAHLLNRIPRVSNELEEDDFVDLAMESENAIETEALNYLGGYIAHKFKNKYVSLGFPDNEGTNNDWIFRVRRKVLYRPSSQFFNNLREVEQLF